MANDIILQLGRLHAVLRVYVNNSKNGMNTTPEYMHTYITSKIGHVLKFLLFKNTVHCTS